MPLFNVRLDAEDARLVSDLRAAGVRLSTVVREAIRAASARYRRQPTHLRPSEILAAIYRDIPEPAGVSKRRRRTGRRAMQQHIRAHLRRRHVG